MRLMWSLRGLQWSRVSGWWGGVTYVRRPAVGKDALQWSHGYVWSWFGIGVMASSDGIVLGDRASDGGVGDGGVDGSRTAGKRCLCITGLGPISTSQGDTQEGIS